MHSHRPSKFSSYDIASSLGVNLPKQNEPNTAETLQERLSLIKNLLDCNNNPVLQETYLEILIPDDCHETRRIKHQHFDDFCDLLDATKHRLAVLDLVLNHKKYLARLLTKQGRVEILAQLHPERRMKLYAAFEKIRKNNTYSTNEELSLREGKKIRSDELNLPETAVPSKRQKTNKTPLSF